MSISPVMEGDFCPLYVWEAQRELEPFDEKVDVSRVFERLNGDDVTLLQEHFYEGTTIQELAEEQGVAWTTMRERVDGVLDRARIVVREEEAPRPSRRRRIVALPMVVFGIIAREARAYAGRFWQRCLVALGRMPERFMASVGAAGALFTATPSAGPCARNQVITADVQPEIQDSRADDGNGVMMTRSPAEAPEVPSSRGESRRPQSRPPQRYKERSTAVWMLANALRDVEERAKK
jgi:hypothetical protein